MLGARCLTFEILHANNYLLQLHNRWTCSSIKFEAVSHYLLKPFWESVGDVWGAAFTHGCTHLYHRQASIWQLPGC